MEIRTVAGNGTPPPSLPVQGQAAAQRPAELKPLGATGEAAGVGSTTKAEPTREQVTQALEQVQQVVRPLAQSLQFSIDKDTHGTIVKIVDTETNKVIRQIPSDEMLQIAKALDKFTGLLMKQEA